MTEDSQFNVTKERRFSAHHMLLGAARMSLEDANKKKPGWFYNELITITFCALALEALCNAFGERFIENWSDFESSTPIAKLRIICSQLNIEADFTKEPWSRAVWVIRFRNKIAHAKPEFLEQNEIWSRDEFDDLREEAPKSKLEKQISLNNANKAYEAAVAIKKALCDGIPVEQQHGLRSDGWSGVSRQV